MVIMIQFLTLCRNGYSQVSMNSRNRSTARPKALAIGPTMFMTKLASDIVPTCQHLRKMS